MLVDDLTWFLKAKQTQAEPQKVSGIGDDKLITFSIFFLEQFI